MTGTDAFRSSFEGGGGGGIGSQEQGEGARRVFLYGPPPSLPLPFPAAWVQSGGGAPLGGPSSTCFCLQHCFGLFFLAWRGFK